MAPRGILIGILGFNLVFMSSTLGFAAQDVPSQHAPATNKYKDEKKEAEEASRTQATLQWDRTPGAATYVVRIAKDALGKSPLYTAEVTGRVYTTPKLSPGQYFYTITSLQDGKPIDTTKPKAFVVGAPFNVTSTTKLPAPQILSPRNSDTFPTYSRVRLAWRPVEGARGYQFRLWEDDKIRANKKIGKATGPRWVTEVPTPWIEVHDAPYSSFMYLDTGLYRWDVAAVDKKGGKIGEPATGYFRVNKDPYLHPKEIFLRLQYGLSPATYDQESAASNSSNKFSLVSHKFYADGDWFFKRHLGLSGGLGLRTINIKPNATTVTANMAHFDLLYRSYLSNRHFGWTLTGSLGMGWIELPQLEGAAAEPGRLNVSNPQAIGVRAGFRLLKTWDSPWSAEAFGSLMLHAFLLNHPGPGEGSIHQPLDIELGARAFRKVALHTALGFGLTAESREIAYRSEGFPRDSFAKITGVSAVLLFQLHYFDADEKE